MQLYVIPPINHMELALQGDGIFALAQFVDEEKYPQYVDFFRQPEVVNKYIIVDSGVAEGEAVSIDTILERAKLIGANEIICPDVLLDKNNTIAQTENFLNSLNRNELRDFKFMSVIQGKTFMEWIDCYEWMLEQPKISVVGLSRYSVPRCFVGGTIKRARINCIEYLFERTEYLFERSKLTKPIHCLGMGCPTEYFYYKLLPKVRSTDGNFPVLCAIKDFPISKITGLGFRERPSGSNFDYFGTIMNNEQKIQAVTNIAKVKAMVN